MRRPRLVSLSPLWMIVGDYDDDDDDGLAKKVVRADSSCGRKSNARS